MKQPIEFRTALLILFSVAIFIAGFLIFKFQTISGNAPVVSITKRTPPSSTIDTSNWKTYADPTYGYPRVKYPSDWLGVYAVDMGKGYVDIASVSSSDIENNDPAGSHEFSFYGGSIDEPGLTPASVTPETFVAYEQKLIASGLEGDVVSTSSITVDGKPAFEYKLASSSYAIVQILFYATSSPGSQTAEVSFDPDTSTSDQELFNAILSTLRFSN